MNPFDKTFSAPCDPSTIELQNDQLPANKNPYMYQNLSFGGPLGGLEREHRPCGSREKAIADAIRAARLEALEEAAAVFKSLRLVERHQQVARGDIPAVQAEMLADMDRLQFLAAIREKAK